MNPDPEVAADLRQLTPGGRMIVWALRATVAGLEDCPLMRKQFSDACGPGGEEARAAFGLFVRQLGMWGRRKVSVGTPGWLGMTRDEQLVLAVFDAAQRGHGPKLRAHLTWLTAGSETAPMLAAVLMVAQALSMSGVEVGPLGARPATPSAVVSDSGSTAEPYAPWRPDVLTA